MNMKTIRLLILTILGIGLICTSCNKEEEPVIKEGEFGLIYLDENGVRKRNWCFLDALTGSQYVQQSLRMNFDIQMIYISEALALVHLVYLLMDLQRNVIWYM